MELNNKQIAGEFSRHNFEITFPFIAVNIEWIMVGGNLIVGKEKVIETCQQSRTTFYRSIYAFRKPGFNKTFR